MLNVVNAECFKYVLNAECHYGDCRYAECHYAECRGAFNFLLFSQIYCHGQLDEMDQVPML
jgi:hypothetical protein